ncbi:MAG: hypothetical protein ACI30O_03330 [Muribaculaceae bacterium]
MKSPTPHPYFPYPAMKLLKEHRDELDAARIATLKQSVALNSADPRAVALFVDLDGDDWMHIYPAAEEAVPLTTGEAIDTFLETYGHSSPQEDALLERMIFNPVPDYSEILAANEAPAPAGADSQDPLISAFLESHPVAQPAAPLPESRPQPIAEVRPDPITESHPEPVAEPAPKPAPKPAAATAPAAEQPSLSESLAQIFIRQGRYERAFEIISALNLKNPEKSIYFADQLRFLQKVIALQQRRAASAGAKNQS